MAKINFTKEHLARLQELMVKALFKNTTVVTKVGTPTNVVELLHCTTLGTLNDIKSALTKKVARLEEADEWVKDNTQQTALDEAKFQKEMVNLIIGYKRFTLEREAKVAEKKKLTEELNKLKDSTKTPEDRIKEMEAQLQSLEEEDFN